MEGCFGLHLRRHGTALFYMGPSGDVVCMIDGLIGAVISAWVLVVMLFLFRVEIGNCL